MAKIANRYGNMDFGEFVQREYPKHIQDPDKLVSDLGYIEVSSVKEEEEARAKLDERSAGGAEARAKAEAEAAEARAVEEAARIAKLREEIRNEERKKLQEEAKAQAQAKPSAFTPTPVAQPGAPSSKLA